MTVRRGGAAAGVATFVAGFALVASAPTALASCAARSAAQVVRETDVVLTGTVLSVDPVPSHAEPSPQDWVVAVSAVHRGTAAATTYVRGVPYSYDPPTVGRLYVFALTREGTVLAAGGCQDVAPADDPTGAALVAAAGASMGPVAADPSLPGATAPVRPVSSSLGWLVGGVGLLLGGGGAAGALGLRSRRVRVRMQ